MDAHERVEMIALKKDKERAEKELLELAQENITAFVLSCKSSGFRTGVKAGFWMGIMVALIVYLIIN